MYLFCLFAPVCCDLGKLLGNGDIFFTDFTGAFKGNKTK